MMLYYTHNDKDDKVDGHLVTQWEKILSVCLYMECTKKIMKHFFPHHIFIEEIYKTLLHSVIHCNQKYLIPKR